MRNCVLCGKPTVREQGEISHTQYKDELADNVSESEILTDIIEGENEIRVLETEIANRKRLNQFLTDHLAKRKGAVPS